jgi:hypothetical protein
MVESDTNYFRSRSEWIVYARILEGALTESERLRGIPLKPQPDSSSIPEIELELRQMMWLGHGHTGMYGDDGEMQCMECLPFGVVDYKCEPLDKVRETFRAVQRERMMKPMDSSSISTEQTFEEWWGSPDDIDYPPLCGNPKDLELAVKERARAAWNAAKGQSNGR